MTRERRAAEPHRDRDERRSASPGRGRRRTSSAAGPSGPRTRPRTGRRAGPGSVVRTSTMPITKPGSREREHEQRHRRAGDRVAEARDALAEQDREEVAVLAQRLDRPRRRRSAGADGGQHLAGRVEIDGRARRGWSPRRGYVVSSIPAVGRSDTPRGYASTRATIGAATTSDAQRRQSHDDRRARNGSAGRRRRARSAACRSTSAAARRRAGRATARSTRSAAISIISDGPDAPAVAQPAGPVGYTRRSRPHRDAGPDHRLRPGRPDGRDLRRPRQPRADRARRVRARAAS